MRKKGMRIMMWAAVAGLGVSGAQAVTVSSISELRQYTAASDTTVSLAAGTYWMESDGSDPVFLDFSGTNSTFDFSGCTILVDTADLSGFGSSMGGHRYIWAVPVGAFWRCGFHVARLCR